MSCESFDKEINGHKYGYTQLPAMESLKLKYRLGKIAGAGIKEMFSALGKDEKKQLSSFAEGIEKILMSNDTDEIVVLLAKIVSPAFRDGERINSEVEFNAAYTGNTQEMYLAIAWILSCEYGSFMKGLEELL